MDVNKLRRQVLVGRVGVKRVKQISQPSAGGEAGELQISCSVLPFLTTCSIVTLIAQLEFTVSHIYETKMLLIHSESSKFILSEFHFFRHIPVTFFPLVRQFWNIFS